MSNLALVSIVVGAVIVAVRAPFVVVPRKTIQLYRLLFATNTRTRILGMTGFILWSTVVVFSRESDIYFAKFVFLLGVICGLASLLFFVVFTTGFRNWVTDLMDSMSENNAALRI
ncbi:MAG: hypothetical protein GY866_02810, partial [Proteobacteria bacterium]|nr:hypothetical protein [Pseudomonadota bacterium]